MSLILHMKISGAIVAAPDFKIAGTEDLWVKGTERENKSGRKERP